MNNKRTSISGKNSKDLSKDNINDKTFVPINSIEDELYIYLVLPMPAVEDYPVYMLIAKNDKQCWQMILDEISPLSDYLKKQFRKEYIIGEKILAPKNEKVRLLW